MPPITEELPNKAVSIFEGLHRDTVKEIDKRAIQGFQKSRSLDGPRGSEVIYVGKWRKEKDLRKFWKWFIKERAIDIKWAVMESILPNMLRLQCL